VDACAPVSFLPEGADAVRLFAGTRGRPGPPLVVTVRGDDGRAVTGGTVAGGYRTSRLDVPVKPAPRNVYGTVVCVHNAGDVPVRFSGNATPLSISAAQGRGNDVIRVDFLRDGSESWWELSPTMAERLALVKPSWIGGWTMWALLGLVALLWAASIAVLRRESR
jgi:hypothetical protein